MNNLEGLEQVFSRYDSSIEEVKACFEGLGIHVLESDIVEKKRQIENEISSLKDFKPHRVPFSVNQKEVSFESQRSEIKPIFQSILHAYDEFADLPALGTLRHNKYEFISYAKLKEKVFSLGFSLQNFGLKKGDFVGVCMRTREEWTVVAHACQIFGFVIVTIYPTLGASAVDFILNSVPCKALFIDGSAKNSTHLFQREGFLEKTFGCDDPKLFKDFNSLLLDSISGITEKIQLPKLSDIMIICFTSGTSGEPKGVMHTHESFAACLSGCYGNGSVLDVGPGDVILGFLPMAHISGWFVDVAFLTCGASIGFFGGDPKFIVQDIHALRPTVLGSVPRVLNRIHGFFQDVVNSMGNEQRKVFDFAKKSKENLRREKGRIHSFWDLVAFSKFRESLGGRVRRIAQGAAPIAPTVLEDLQILLSCKTATMYGMTEIGLVTATDSLDVSDTGSVGCPVSGAIKLVRENVSHPDKSIFRGELCFKGPSLMKGYFNRPDLTKLCFDEDGFFHSGDIAKVNDMGCIAIIDRVKALLKLSQGEYVSPERVELACLSHRDVSQAFVWGDSLWDFVVAVIVLNPTSSIQNRNELFIDIQQSAKDFGLSHFEIPRFFHVSEKTFDELDLLTPTAKLKRRDALAKFRDEILSSIKN